MRWAAHPLSILDFHVRFRRALHLHPEPLMVSLLRLVRRRIGVRGEFLLALGLLDVFNAARLIWPSTDTRASPTMQFLAAVLPLPVWGAVWAAVGLLCVVQAFALRDRWAFFAASGLKVGWGVLHAAAWLWGVPQAWWSVVIWLAFGRVVHTIAKLPEPVDPHIPAQEG